LTASPSSLSIGNKVTKAVTLSVNNATTVTTIAATANSNTSHISVSLAPGQSATVSNGSGSAIFNILLNGTNQSGTITFTAVSGCGATATVTIN
jgi:hypothetical protein